MPDWEVYQEAYRRGILSPEKRELFEEAVSRGLISSPPGHPPDSSYLPESPMGKLVAGVGGGMVNLAEGAKQRTLELGEWLGVTKPETVTEYQKYIDEMKRIDKPLYETTPGKIGQIAGEAALTAPIPGGVTGGLIRRGITAATAGGLIGAAQPTTGQESPVLNIGVGAAAGGVMAGALGVGSKIYNAAAGKTKNAIQDMLDRYGLGGTLGDITQNPRIQKAETILEEIPVIGTTKRRLKEGEKLKQVGKGLVSKYVYDPASTDIRQMNRDYANALFENMERKVRQIPVANQSIYPTETRAIAKEFLDRYPKIFETLQDPKMKAILDDILLDTGVPQGTSGYIQRSLHFKEAWTLREGLGDLIGQARQKITSASGDVNEKQLGELKGLFEAANKDIENWSQRIGRPDVKESIEAANKAYKDFVVKYALISDAMWKATAKRQVFSSKVFSNELQNLIHKEEKGRYGGLFNPQEIEEITGVAQVMQYMKRAGEVFENPPTGNRWGLPVFGGSLLGYGINQPVQAGMTAAGFVSAAGVARFLTATTAGKRLALAASKVEPRSETMKLIMRTVYNQVPKTAAVGVTTP